MNPFKVGDMVKVRDSGGSPDSQAKAAGLFAGDFHVVECLNGHNNNLLELVGVHGIWNHRRFDPVDPVVAAIMQARLERHKKRFQKNKS